jgi:hypothetical protein
MESISALSCNYMEKLDSPLQKLDLQPYYPLDYLSNDNTHASIRFMSQELWLPEIPILLNGVLLREFLGSKLNYE